MSKFLIFAVAASFALAIPEAGYASEREKATYVGDGRYVGEGNERYERAERLERDDNYRDRSEHY